nr:hypothetical protein [Tanacetum cinerariifolium]
MTLTAPRVIEIDEPVEATDSSGVPLAIKRSPLDFADEAEAFGRETAVPEMPPPEEVFLWILATPIHCLLLALLHPLLLMLPIFNISDPDPLSFAGAPSSPPADVAQSSQGVAVAGDPVSENVSSPVEVGSSRSVYRPEWGVTNGSLLDTPEACQDLVD